MTLRENLRAWMGEVRRTPLAGGGLVAEARLDGTALLQKVLGNQRNRNVVAGAGYQFHLLYIIQGLSIEHCRPEGLRMLPTRTIATAWLFALTTQSRTWAALKWAA